MIGGVDQFSAAMIDHGLEPPPIIEPGRLHRFSSNGKPSDDAAWCRLFDDGTGGVFGDWRTGLFKTWQARREKPYSPEERVAFRRRCVEARREREAEKKRQQAQAREVAQKIWTSAEPARHDHPYLTRKQVNPVSTLREIRADRLSEILGYSPKSRGEPLTGRVLLAPVKVGDSLSTLEMIDGDGRKSAICGGQKAGGYWAAQRLPEGDGHTLLIGEGVATVLSAREASGQPVIAALSCHNLETVARTMRDRYPKTKIVILGDLGNGQKDAELTARSVGASLALPDFGKDRPDSASDFNDMARLRGLEIVREAIEAASNTDTYRTPAKAR